MPADQRRTARLTVALLAVAVAFAVAVVLVVWWSAGPGSQGQSDDRAGGGASARSAPSTAGSGRTQDSGLPTVQLADLPAEARRALDLIAAGGPYPYPRDGAVFQNRERHLTRKSSGYYHEYTVPTPGEVDRGARRIITGRGGERYWTPDHYTSFRVIVPSVVAGGGP